MCIYKTTSQRFLCYFSTENKECTDTYLLTNVYR